MTIEQKKNGRIKHLGFSCHGEMDVLKRFLDAYGKDMEFCQLQINYFDWEFQHGKEKVELLKEWNIPVWVIYQISSLTSNWHSPICLLSSKAKD